MQTCSTCRRDLPPTATVTFFPPQPLATAGALPPKAPLAASPPSPASRVGTLPRRPSHDWTTSTTGLLLLEHRRPPHLLAGHDEFTCCGRGGAAIDAGVVADLLQHGEGRRRCGQVRRGDVEVLLVQGAEPGSTAPQAGGGDPAPGLRRLPQERPGAVPRRPGPPSRQQPDGVRPGPGVLPYSCSDRGYCLGWMWPGIDSRKRRRELQCGAAICILRCKFIGVVYKNILVSAVKIPTPRMGPYPFTRTSYILIRKEYFFWEKVDVVIFGDQSLGFQQSN